MRQLFQTIMVCFVLGKPVWAQDLGSDLPSNPKDVIPSVAAEPNAGSSTQDGDPIEPAESASLDKIIEHIAREVTEQIKSDLAALNALNALNKEAAIEAKDPSQIDLTIKAARQVLDETSPVYLGKAGRIVQTFGQSIPRLVCRVGQHCIMELEPGEIVADTPVFSDTARWDVSLRMRDTGQEQIYVSVKPQADAAETTLTLITDRRVYSVLLVPDLYAHTMIMSFKYPDSERRALEAQIEAQKAAISAQEEAENTTKARALEERGVQTAQGPVPAEELDFKYRVVSGKAAFKPVRIYTDGIKTYIELPGKYRGEYPVVVVSNPANRKSINLVYKFPLIIVDRKLGDFQLKTPARSLKIKKG